VFIRLVRGIANGFMADLLWRMRRLFNLAPESWLAQQAGRALLRMYALGGGVDDGAAHLYDQWGAEGARCLKSLLSRGRLAGVQRFYADILVKAVVNAQNETPTFLLIVREWLHPGSLQAYNENELKLATACATLNCPHPYLALTAVDEPTEVWWLNAFASVEQRDALNDSYARNEPLMVVLIPLGKRKEDFRAALTTSVAKHVPALSGDVAFQVAGARFIVVRTRTNPLELSGAVFETGDGKWLTVGTTATLEAAETLASRFGSDTTILSIQPQWSFPDQAWVRADPEFWDSNPAARNARVQSGSAIERTEP
jgi:hypothetical protein